MGPRMAATNWFRLTNVEAPAALEARPTRTLTAPRLVRRTRPTPTAAKGPARPVVLRTHRVAA